MNMKKNSVLCIIVGALVAVIGFVFLNVYDGSNYYRYSSTTRDIMESFPYVLIALGVICVLLGIILAFVNISTATKTLVERTGKVIEKTPGVYDNVLVEFENGSRERLVVSDNRKIILSVNDTGKFSTKGKYIVGFEKAS